MVSYWKGFLNSPGAGVVLHEFSYLNVVPKHWEKDKDSLAASSGTFRTPLEIRAPLFLSPELAEPLHTYAGSERAGT